MVLLTSSPSSFIFHGNCYNSRTPSRAHTKYVNLWLDYQFIQLGGTILYHWISLLHMVLFVDIHCVQQSEGAPQDIKGTLIEK